MSILTVLISLLPSLQPPTFQARRGEAHLKQVYCLSKKESARNQSMWAVWSGERSGHISFRAESVFLKIALRSLNMLRRLKGGLLERISLQLWFILILESVFLLFTQRNN